MLLPVTDHAYTTETTPQTVKLKDAQRYAANTPMKLTFEHLLAAPGLPL